MLGQGGNIGMSNSAPGTGQAPTMQAPQIPHLESSFMQGLRTMRETTASRLALSQAGLADTQGKRIETLLPLEQSQILGNIDYLKKLGLTEDERRELVHEQTEALFEQNSFTRLTAGLRFRQQIAYTNEAEAEATLASLSVQQQQFVAQYFEPQAWVNFATSLQGLANMVIEGKVKTNQAKLILQQITETYWRMMREKQQYNIDKPKETLAGFEDTVYNSDAGIYSYDSDGKPIKGSGLPFRQQFFNFTRSVFFNNLQSSFNQSLQLSIQDERLAGRWNGYINFMDNIGDGLRGLAGGLLAPYAGLPKLNFQPKANPIGFRP